MGVFGWISRKAKVVSEVFSNAFKATGRAVSKSYKTFTGQATFEEADRLYEDVKKRFEAHKKYFEQQVESLSNQIEKEVRLINSSKETIKKELFPVFADKMRRLKDIPVSDEYMKEYFAGSRIKVDSIKAKADLYLIDFKRHPFKNNSLAIITLGFYTRKKAKQTLEKVKEEKARLEEEMARMDSELVKLRRIKDALSLIAEYYISLVELYRVLLVRLDNSVNYLMIRCLSLTHKILRENMSIKLLPKSQQSEIMAMVSISKILKKMVDTSVTMDGRSENIASDVNSAKNSLLEQRKIINEYYKTA